MNLFKADIYRDLCEIVDESRETKHFMKNMTKHEITTVHFSQFDTIHVSYLSSFNFPRNWRESR